MTRFLFGGVLIVAAVVVGSSGRGQEKKAAPKGDGIAQKAPRYIGSARCKSCHIDNRAEDGVMLEPETKAFILTEGVKVAFEADKHQIAYTVLTGDLGNHMAAVLKQDVTKPEAGCLGCHALNVPPQARFNKFSLAEGVSCESCHGPSEAYYLPHTSRAEWRILDPERKEELGLRDLRDPAKRSQLCLSCHVGDREQGRVITHEMYAAGHPPLPAFELSAFMDRMPPHWRLKKDNPYLNRKDAPAEEQSRFHYVPGEQERTRMVAEGALGAFREAMRLLAAEADAIDKAENGNRALDLANFDCLACHHDLKTKSWRQQRGYHGTPGRPTLRAWPAILVPVAMRHGFPDPAIHERAVGAFRTLWGDLEKAIDERPFGNPAAVAKAAKALQTWADGQLTVLQKAPYDVSSSRRVLGELTRAAAVQPQVGFLDYDAARLLSWAYQGLRTEMPPPVERGDPVYRRLDEALMLVPPKVPTIDDYLAEFLKRMNDFHPSKFRDAFGRYGPSPPSP